ncbi:MAG: lytic murein transglycosylase [Alphaproteobacteria bacterium]|nr:lytic murein transglycosylase [Alphaproteobacteria bacterium]
MRRTPVLVLFAAAMTVMLSHGILAQVTESKPTFGVWLEGVHKEGLAKGISKKTLDQALNGLTRIERVIKLDRRQPEFTQTFHQYIDKRVSAWRVRTGRERLAAHGDILNVVGKRFGVQPRFIVALWGIETSFGAVTGGFSVIRALATLAFDGRRSAYFRRELFNALKIIDEGHIGVAEMKGSWAGAMGQNQFMPSSFLSYAVDFNGDGRRDIWGTLEDVFASAANYLKRAGWRGDQNWGREVKLPPDFGPKLIGLMPKTPPKGCRALRKLSVSKTLPQWQALGIRQIDGNPLSSNPIKASLVLPDGPGGPAFLVYGNFRATLRWNCSILFAAAVGILADRLAQR